MRAAQAATRPAPLEAARARTRLPFTGRAESRVHARLLGRPRHSSGTRATLSAPAPPSSTPAPYPGQRSRATPHGSGAGPLDERGSSRGSARAAGSGARPTRPPVHGPGRVARSRATPRAPERLFRRPGDRSCTRPPPRAPALGRRARLPRSRPAPKLPPPMRAATTFLAATCAAAKLAAQDASPYVPLGHWAMPYVEQLIATGAIADPTPLTRPLRRADLRRALAAADTTALSPAARATVRRLLREFTPREPAAHYRAEWSGGLAAASYAFRDPLELDRGVPPRRAVARGSARASLELAFAFGPLVAVSHPAVDSRLQFDPDWYGKSDNATRFEEAYVSAQWRHGEVFFGILDRNWGPSGVQ